MKKPSRFHARQDFVSRQTMINRKRFDRCLQKARWLLHALAIIAIRVLEGSANADVQRRMVDRPGAVMSPGSAKRRRQRKKIAGDNAERQLGAAGRLEVATPKLIGPRVADVSEKGRVHGVKKERPGPNPSLRPGQRPAV